MTDFIISCLWFSFSHFMQFFIPFSGAEDLNLSRTPSKFYSIITNYLHSLHSCIRSVPLYFTCFLFGCHIFFCNLLFQDLKSGIVEIEGQYPQLFFYLQINVTAFSSFFMSWTWNPKVLCFPQCSMRFWGNFLNLCYELPFS